MQNSDDSQIINAKNTQKSIDIYSEKCYNKKVNIIDKSIYNKTVIKMTSNNLEKKYIAVV